MEDGMELLQACADLAAAQHLNFIKTNGEKGRSAIADMAAFEDLEKYETNRYATLKSEYFILKTLTRAMREDLRRMEEEEN